MTVNPAGFTRIPSSEKWKFNIANPQKGTSAACHLCRRINPETLAMFWPCFQTNGGQFMELLIYEKNYSGSNQDPCGTSRHEIIVNTWLLIFFSPEVIRLKKCDICGKSHLLLYKRCAVNC